MRVPTLITAFLTLALALSAFPAGAAEARADEKPGLRDVSIRDIEDDAALRRELRNGWLAGEAGRVPGYQSETRTLRSGARVQVRVETAGDEFSVVLAREWNGSPEMLAYVQRQTGAAWPGWTQGSWAFTRSRADGSLRRARLFLRSDWQMYVQFNPFPRSKEKTTMDVVVYGAYCVQGLTLALPFERLCVTPLKDILALAGDGFPRRYFEPDAGAYRDKRELIGKIRAALPGLAYEDDGAIGEDGRFVFIKDLAPQNGDGRSGGLNCSGFAKWVVDGLLRPVTGERLAIAPLKEAAFSRGSSFTAPYEELREPFFGLDWTRNLAAAAASRLRSPSFAALEEIEVRDWPFLELIIRNNRERTVTAYPGFLLNAGFGIEGLQPLLYTLAVDEPGAIYLASVNREMTGPPRRGEFRSLALRQHYHIAALVPYFNEYGTFQIAVFESAAETTFASFTARHPGACVNLVRIPSGSGFEE